MERRVRLNKYLAERLGVSRREADKLITLGLVTVNGEPAKIGVKVDNNDEVCYNNNILPSESKLVYLAFNKPVGYVCSRRAQGDSHTIYELLPPKYRNLKTVGRLDKDTSGIIILTNDGDFAFQMTHPKFHKEKVYEVELDNRLETTHFELISQKGVELDDGLSRFIVNQDKTKPVLADGSAGAYIVKLTEGRNRQIRRTFAALGYKVTKLHRIQFSKFALGDLESGKFEEIKP